MLIILPKLRFQEIKHKAQDHTHIEFVAESALEIQNVWLLVWCSFYMIHFLLLFFLSEPKIMCLSQVELSG